MPVPDYPMDKIAILSLYALGEKYETQQLLTLYLGSCERIRTHMLLKVLIFRSTELVKCVRVSDAVTMRPVPWWASVVSSISAMRGALQKSVSSRY